MLCLGKVLVFARRFPPCEEEVAGALLPVCGELESILGEGAMSVVWRRSLRWEDLAERQLSSASRGALEDATTRERWENGRGHHDGQNIVLLVCADGFVV